MKLYDMDQQTRIDEFGVDHSNFSLRDEIEYNFRRAKEREMKQNKYQELAKSYADTVPIDYGVNLANQNGYNIRDDNNYAWDMPHKYDHRPNNIFAQVHNFQEINKEYPVQKPITTNSKLADFAVKRVLSRISPYIPLGINAYNWGYQGAGYYDNWKRAKDAGKYQEYPDIRQNEFFLKNK